MVGYLVSFILVFLIGLAVFVLTRPDAFQIARTGKIDAPPHVVFPIINDLRQWNRWSPFDKYDPNMKKTYEGPASGPGAQYAWSGNDRAGEGRMAITDIKLNERVAMDLEFTRPFKATNKVNFVIEPAGTGSNVSWIMDGKNNLFMKFFSLIMNMNKVVGKEFEEGLANLNRVALEESRKLM